MLMMFPAFSFGQEYSSMPAEVQSKMNLNKSEGKELLYGVETVFSITLSNVSAANVQALTNLIAADAGVRSFTISSDYKSMNAICKAFVQIEDMKKHIGNVNGEIDQYTQLYRLEH